MEIICVALFTWLRCCLLHGYFALKKKPTRFIHSLYHNIIKHFKFSANNTLGCFSAIVVVNIRSSCDNKRKTSTSAEPLRHVVHREQLKWKSLHYIVAYRSEVRPVWAWVKSNFFFILTKAPTEHIFCIHTVFGLTACNILEHVQGRLTSRCNSNTENMKKTCLLFPFKTNYTCPEGTL